MTLRENLLPTVDKLRKLPGKLGFRPYSVQLVQRSGGDWKAGIEPTTEVLTDITVADGYAPKVRWVSQGEYARGLPLDCVLEVGPVTPAYSGSSTGGYSYDDLEGAAAGSHVFYRIFGEGFPASGGWFEKISFSGNRSLGYFIQLRRAPDGNS